MQIVGEQIILRDWELGDIPAYRHWNTGQQKWMHFDGPYYPKMSAEQLEQNIGGLEKRIEAQDFPTPRIRLAIADNQNNQLLGSVSWYWQSQETHWMSNGIVIYDPAYWSKGIGQEALKLWGTYLFHSFPEIMRLDLRTWSGNKGMMRLAEKLGYRLEARFRNARIVEGKYYDGLGYGVLREEWKW